LNSLNPKTSFLLIRTNSSQVHPREFPNILIPTPTHPPKKMIEEMIHVEALQKEGSRPTERTRQTSEEPIALLKTNFYYSNSTI